MKKNDKIIKYHNNINRKKELIKIIFTIAILSSTSIYANSNELISKDIMKAELISILEKVKKYKEKTENEKKQLQERLSHVQKEFKQYKAKKQKEIANINTQLKITRKKLLKNKKKLRISQKKKKIIHEKIVYKKIIPKKIIPKKKVVHQKIVQKKIIPKKRVPKKKVIHQKIVQKKIIPKKRVPKKKVIHQKIVQKKIIPKKIVPKKKVIHQKVVYTNIIPKKTTPLPVVKNLPWVEIVVEDNINIYQLALRYYGDKNKYKEIYAANQHVIGKNFKIYNGMSLKIPMSNQFEEKPMILNRD